jgi:ABC-type dipeptide transport system, periplasmic component
MWFSTITRDFWLKGLWSFDENNEPVPEIAAEIPTLENGGLSEDGKIILLRLRNDVTWSDGEPLTANDFVFTYDMIVSGQNSIFSGYPYDSYVSSVEAIDDYTVSVIFSEPFAPWLTTLFAYVLPKHILQPVFDKDGTLANAEWNMAPTVGLGPFVFSEWVPGSHIIFKANPDWIKPPKLEEVVINFVPDDAAQEAAIINSNTDIGVYLSSDQIGRVEGDVVDVIGVPSGYNEGWFLNVNPDTAHPAMLDVNVRKAIALATDRFTIVKELLNEEINPVNVTFWDTTLPYGTPDLEPYPYDPEKAAALLDEAGWIDSNRDGIRDKDGVELVLRYISTDREIRKRVQEIVQQQWSSVGIGAEVVNYSSSEYFNSYDNGGPQAQGLYDIAEYSNSGEFPDPEASGNWLCSDIASADNPNGPNTQGVCLEELDALLHEQTVTIDRQKRIELYHQIEQILYDQVLYIGMWEDPDLYAVNKRLQNVRLSGSTPFWNAHEWEIAQ